MDYTKQQIKFICEILWGCVPSKIEGKFDPISTKLFIDNADNILLQYPLLNKSIEHSNFIITNDINELRKLSIICAENDKNNNFYKSI